MRPEATGTGDFATRPATSLRPDLKKAGAAPSRDVSARRSRLGTSGLALRFGPSSFGIYGRFDDEAGRQAHLNGPIAAALMARADEWLAQPPRRDKVDILMSVKPTPDGYHSITPYMIVDNAAQAIAFYREALGAQELFRLPMPDGNGGQKIGHAEIRIGDSTIMLSDEWPDLGALGPNARGGATTTFMIYVPDVDAAFERAVKAGGKVERPIENQFWGDRTGTIVDPFGHKWTLGTHVEDLSPEELQRRMEAWLQQLTG